jgi:Tol biopolymer transport system component
VPRWSPDGQRIAFYSNRSGHYEIWTVREDGSGLQRLTHVDGPVVGYPVWSPDGTHLAYTAEGVGTFIIDATKSWEAQTPQPFPMMTDPAGQFVAWSWSPDGSRVAGWNTLNPGLFIYTFESRQYKKVADFGMIPVWLGDARRLLFPRGSSLYLADTQSGRVRELFSIAPLFAGAGAVTKDNRHLYFSVFSTEADIWLMSLE